MSCFVPVIGNVTANVSLQPTAAAESGTCSTQSTCVSLMESTSPAASLRTAVFFPVAVMSGENDSSAPNLVPAVHQKFSELFP